MIRLIAAVDRKQGIAKQGFQPWYIPHDEQYFTEQTKKYGGNVLYGRLTFHLSLKDVPLEGRRNFLLTRDTTPVEGVEMVHDLEHFLKNPPAEDVWIIGGANVFSQAVQLGAADELYLTHIEADFGCDQFFPEYQSFTRQSQSELREENGFIFSYAVYAKAG